jgi:3-deoxy-D-manno-octulosonic-acid transferase
LIIYNFIIKIFGGLIWLSQPLLPKAKKWITGRRNIWQHLQQAQVHKHTKVWVHCSSLGEFEQGRPVIEKIKTDYPYCDIILTFFSPSGYEIRRNYPVVDQVCYLPLDTKKNAEKFVGLLKPDLVIFVKYDFWFNSLSVLNQQKIPFIFISSVFPKNHFLFRSWAKPLFKIFSEANHVFVQDEVSFNLLSSRNCAVSVAGDTRVDSVIQLQKNLKEYPLLEKLLSDRNVIIFGSIWLEDLERVRSWINEQIDDKNYFLIIAPHDVSSQMLGKIETVLDGNNIRFSQLAQRDKKVSCIIVDTIGDLAHLYRFGDLAYVGGGFGKSIHSILEPIAANLPVIFGPKHHKFKEAQDLMSLGAARCIESETGFRDAIDYFENRANKKRARQGISKFLNDHQGATSKIVHYLAQRKLLS